MLELKINGQVPEISAFEAELENVVAEIKNDQMSGWLTLPTDYDKDEFLRIKTAAKKINSDSKFLVCIGIGGSYLGHRAVIEALNKKSPTKILYSGNNLSTFAMQKIFDEIGDADFSVNVISKSGTTTEPAVAFRIFKQKLIDKYGEKEAYKRIYATTDANKGALHDEAKENDYASFVVPDEIGGRYSVLTAVGLLPIAAAGVDLDELMAGAKEEQDADHKHIYRYAALRAALAEENYDTEIMVTFEPEMFYFEEWWKQLYGESEGKGDQGIFPASIVGTTDLHSLGQYLQQGRKNIFSTFLNFTGSYLDHGNTHPDDDRKIVIEKTENDQDGLNFLAGKTLDYVNSQAYQATVTAHSEHHPVFELMVPDISERSLGAMIYFFELSCAVSAKLQGVNPFDQLGVEAYKNEMFRLLGKPGYTD